MYFISLFRMTITCMLKKFIWRKSTVLYLVCVFTSPSMVFLWMSYCNYWVTPHNIVSLEGHAIYNMAGRDDLVHLCRPAGTAARLYTGESLYVTMICSRMSLQIHFWYSKFMKTWHALWKCCLFNSCFRKRCL